MGYGPGEGHKDALAAVAAINAHYHAAPHHAATLTLASADGVSKVLRMVCAPGDHVLADEFTFTPLALAAEAHGARWVPVRMDAGGLVPEELGRILEGWDKRRGRRPHVLFNVP